MADDKDTPVEVEDLTDYEKKNLGVIKRHSKPDDLGVIKGESIAFTPVEVKDAYSCSICGSLVSVEGALVLHMDWHHSRGEL